MVKNYFYLVVGLLCILFAVTHTLNGSATILSALDVAGIDPATKNIFTYVWHIIGAENLVFGVALLIMAFQRSMAKTRFASLIIISILVLRWVVIAFFTLNSGITFTDLLPDTIAIFVVIVLMLFGIRVKDKQSN